MKVILLRDEKSLGRAGEEISVKDGYARNYLIPQKIVLEACPGALRVLEQKKLQKERRDKKVKEEYVKFAEKIAAVSCTISVESGEEDKLFGSVTSDMIAESLCAEGIEVDKKKINLEEPIKSLGVYNVEVRLHPEVKAQVRVWVVKK